MNSERSAGASRNGSPGASVMAGFARVLGWLPTPTIGLYVVRNFLALFAMVLLILVGVLQTLDLVTRADEIGVIVRGRWRWTGRTVEIGCVSRSRG